MQNRSFTFDVYISLGNPLNLDISQNFEEILRKTFQKSWENNAYWIQKNLWGGTGSGPPRKYGDHNLANAFLGFKGHSPEMSATP